MKASITGSHGFIGSALKKKLEYDGVEVFSTIRPDVDVVYLFGAPSSNILFDENIDRCFSDTISGFLDAVKFCRDHKIKLVYPSSATIYNKNTSYARCKAALEEIHMAYGGDILGLRIFAGYGPGEEHKGRYASTLYQFCKSMKVGEPAVIYGDGSQSRDFIYIDDIIRNILFQSRFAEEPIVDVGTGINTSFLEIVDIINSQIPSPIAPVFVPKPLKYINDTPCQHVAIPPSVSMEEGIKKVLESL